MQDLDEFLEAQNLEGVLGVKVAVPGSAGPREKPRPKWGWRWFLRGSLGDNSDTTHKPPPAPESRADVTWLGELQCVGREIEREQTWADYDAELTSILGIEGGAEEIFVRLSIPFLQHVVCVSALRDFSQRTTASLSRQYSRTLGFDKKVVSDQLHVVN